MPLSWPIGTVFLAPDEESTYVLWPDTLETPEGEALRQWPLKGTDLRIPVREVFVRGVTHQPISVQGASHILRKGNLPPIASQPFTLPLDNLQVHVLDLHVLQSKRFSRWGQNTRSPVGEILYRVKYATTASTPKFHDLIYLLASTLAYQIRQIHKSSLLYEAIVPAPPTLKRPQQPLLLLAHALGDILGLPVQPVLQKRGEGTPAKDIPLEQRRQELEKQIHIQTDARLPERILLLDDLVGTGATLEVSATKLLHHGVRFVEAWALTHASSQTLGL